MNCENKNELEMLDIINGIKKKYVKNGCKHIGITFDYDCGICKYNNFIERAIVKHSDRYDYSSVEYVDSKTKIKIGCMQHGYYYQTPSDHLASNGCRKCHFNKLSILYKKTAEQFVEDAIKIHGDKYDYSKVDYKNNKQDVIIKCKKCSLTFKQSPDKHLKGQGCPKCQLSIGENLIILWLKNNNIKYHTQKTYANLLGMGGGRLKYDFYLVDKNLLIEYDGIQHFQRGYFNGKPLSDVVSERARIHDELKTKYASQNRIELLRIPYTKMNKIAEILTQNLL